MKEAPFFDDLAEGPDGARAYWLRAADEVRLRICFWETGPKGTVLLFPGRTEYCEKYGPVAADFARRGYASLAIDWRGQGLADRMLPDPDKGHVGKFKDYQHDVRSALEAASAAGLPEPYYLIAHSMGGCIGLRALHEGLPVRAAAFSAPMWGIGMSTLLRPVAWTVSWAARQIEQGSNYAPGTSKVSYIATAPFEENSLTTDPDMWAFMKRQTLADPRLALGGPTLHWLIEALEESRDLRNRKPPPVAAYTALGSEETVIDPARVHQVMDRWKGGTLDLIAGARHELLMETPAVRTRVHDAVEALFSANA